MAEPDYSPLNSRESGQWFLGRLAGGTGIGTIAFAARYRRHLRWWPMREALRLLAARHSALRQTFPGVGGVPFRRIAPADGFEVPISVVAATEEDLDGQVEQALAEPFDLGSGPLVRATQVLLERDSVLVLAAHHISVDGHSLNVLADEFAHAYQHFAEEEPLPSWLRGPVPAFSPATPSAEAVARVAADFEGIAGAPVGLSGARPLTGTPTFAGEPVAVPADQRLHHRLSDLRSTFKVTHGMLILALGAVLLHRHGVGDDLVVGVPLNLRHGPGTGRAVGFHVSTVPVRFRMPPGTTFRQVVAQARQSVLNMLDGEPVSYEDLLQHAGHHAADWRTPLFRHVMNIHPLSGAADRLPLAGDVRVLVRGSRADLELTLELNDTSPDVCARYSTEVHDREEILGLLRRFAPLTAAVHAAPDLALTRLPIHSEHDRHLIDATNATTVPLPDTTLWHLVRERAAESPEQPAIVGDDGETWTYGRLWDEAGRVAGSLAALGVGRGDRVALAGGRGPLLAAAVLGIWECGASYLPVDPADPRLSGRLDGVAGVVATEGGWRPEVADAGFFVLDPANPPVPGGARPGTGVTPADRATLIHTSGTTGRPKGVVVTHRAMLNVVLAFADALAFGPGDRMLWSTTYGFDVSALELFVPLVRGGTVVTSGDDVRLRPRRLLRLVAERGVRVVQATPTLWRRLVDADEGELSGVVAISGGEPLTAALAERLLARGCRMFNAYGPTETTIWSTLAEITMPVTEPVTVGLPIANTTVQIRDPAGAVCPPGVIGELCIGGVGLADGYLEQPALTAERFVAVPEGREYRTGDRARRLPDGSLVLHGREDRQVKIRGHRIEPGAVEAALESHPEVLSSAVCAGPGPDGDDVLIAFCTSRPESGDEAEWADRLWRHAREHLPPHEVPGRILPVAALPVTPSGKVDHGRLRAIVPANTPPPREPEDPMTRALLAIWCDLLGVRVGQDANFFLHGGHSLLAVRLISEIAERLGREVDLAELFSAPTPARLAERLGAGSETPEEQDRPPAGQQKTVVR
ncbi:MULTISPECIES: non-ribosomal peptide synthetase [unclassified Nonomuraea]|uniref:non-ribosomal peptide synthetase n=1 Tax=unclassified Nonomuraea TaxID=2593643 RepID=UPI001378208D|nr:non-ribosomal peptide synthetase [Nonomuraea sp. KC401]NBE97994.1 amino acid adenylation domain-containing protein [Nonomuraea sp. K271]